MSKKILVTGATGQLGRAVVKALSNKGFKLKLASTNPAKLSSQSSAEVVKMDYNDPATFDEAFKDVDSLFLIALPLDPQAPEKLRPVIDKAKTHKLNHIVFISALGVDQNEQAPLRIAERYLMDSGINYTILRPNFFMENFSTGFIAPTITSNAAIYLAADKGKTSFVSTKDIAEVTATAFTKKLYGKEYNLTGLQALDHNEAAMLISEVISKPVTYHALSEEQMIKAVRDSGMLEGSVQYLAFMYSLVRKNLMAVVTQDVEKLTGKKPKTFLEFAKENRSFWM